MSIKVDLNGVTGVEWGGYFVPLPKDVKYKPSNLKLPGAHGGAAREGGPPAASNGGGGGGGAAPAGGGGGHGGGH